MAVMETRFSTPYEQNVSSRQIGRGYQKTIIVDHEPKGTKRSASPDIPSKPGNRHLTISVIMLIISAIFCNPLALLCAIPAVIFSVKARSAEMEGKKEEMQANDKTAFGFAIFSVIGWIISICVTGFVVYRDMCGPTGARCDTRTHV